MGGLLLQAVFKNVIGSVIQLNPGLRGLKVQTLVWYTYLCGWILQKGVDGRHRCHAGTAKINLEMRDCGLAETQSRADCIWLL